MNKINVNIYSGDFIIETAEVGLVSDAIVEVTLTSNKHRLGSIKAVEATRMFWREEFKRLGWDVSERDLIGRSIGMNLYLIEDDFQGGEDSWIDAAYEDRFACVEYFE